MKKLSFIVSLIIFGQLAFGQAVHDRNVIPVAVNLNQVLRMTITNGGNIEFVFNSIDDYRFGLSADRADIQNEQDAEVIAAAANPVGSGPGTAVATNFYKTDFTVASSTRWRINWGAEEATFIGTDNPATVTFTLDNVGFELIRLGTHTFGASTVAKGVVGNELYSGPTDNGNSVTALVVYPAANFLIEDNDDPADANAGDATDNSFELLWRCGTSEAGNVAAPGPYNLNVVPMNAQTILNQGDILPDRYVTNVLFELATDF